MSQAFSRLHRAIQHALWDMRWTELRPLQVRAIESFFASDRAMILSAATASGKTEAAFLPVLSAITDNPVGSVRALYVGPLKALINDQFLRLEELCQRTDIPVHRWHGDVSSTDKQKLRKQPGGVLLITPESLESAFINYGTQVPRIFAGLDYVVIDELHAFIADVRGTHLRSLIARLAQAIGRTPRQLGLSATLADFASARSFLDHDHPDTVEVIEDEPGARSIKIGLRAYPRPAPRDPADEEQAEPTPRLAATAVMMAQVLRTLDAEPLRDEDEDVDGDDVVGDAQDDEEDGLRNLASDLAQVFRSKTNLIFTNSRALGEMLADEINQIAGEERWMRNPFVLHHGSLSRDIRQDVESRLKGGEALSVLCTSTLEMGIDIGSVYAVGQLGPPWSVASLVQRLGRSGRREGEAAILRLYSLDPPPEPDSDIGQLLCPQLLRSIAMIQLMIERWLEPFDNDRFHFSTLIHQILSVLRQTGGAKADRIYHALVARGAFRHVEAQHFTAVLRVLAAKKLIEQVPTGELILAPDGEHVTHSRDFYAAFVGSIDFSIRHEQDEIGKLPADLVPPVEQHLLLNGKRWQVVEVDPRAQIAQVIRARGRKRPLFHPTGGAIHRVIMEKMREVLAGSEVPGYLHADAAQLLTAVRGLARRRGVLTRPWLGTGARRVVFPWTGTKGMVALQQCAAADGIPTEVEVLSIEYQCKPERLRQHLERVARREFDPLALASKLMVRGCDKFDDLVPEELLDLSNSERMLSVEDAGEAARAVLDRAKA